MSNLVTCYALLARTGTPTVQGDQVNNGRYKGIMVVIDTTAAGVSPSTVFTIEGRDPLSGKYFTILASAAITGVGTVILRVYPGLTAAANLVASDVLPRVWRIKSVHGNGTSHTYSVSAHLIP